MTATEEGLTSEYVVVWFPPEGDKSKAFKDNKRAPAEDRARAFADSDLIAEWNPLLIHRLTLVTEEILPL